MRLLLTGRQGQLGRELERTLRELGSVVATERTTLDLADLAAVGRAVRDAAPEVIVNAAAHTAVDRAEAEEALATRINAEAPAVLAEEAKRIGALLVHYSTDYVFDGGGRTPYTEDDACNPQSAYGRSKLAGERAVLASGCRCLVFRTSWVYSPEGRNFFLTIAGKVRAGQALRIVDDQVGVPTSAAFLARSTAMAIRGTRGGPPPHSLYHLVPAGAVSWHGFACEIAARLAPGAQISPISSSEYPQAAMRPKYSVMDSALARAELGIAVPHWTTLLDECVATYSKAQGYAPSR